MSKTKPTLEIEGTARSIAEIMSGLNSGEFSKFKVTATSTNDGRDKIILAVVSGAVALGVSLIPQLFKILDKQTEKQKSDVTVNLGNNSIKINSTMSSEEMQTQLKDFYKATRITRIIRIKTNTHYKMSPLLRLNHHKTNLN